MNTICDIIHKILDKMSLIEGYQIAWLMKNWQKIMSIGMNKHTKPYKISNKILYISVDSSVWNQAVYMEKKHLIDKINQTYTKKIIKDIKIQIGNTQEFNENNKMENIISFHYQDRKKNEPENKILEILYSKKKTMEVKRKE